jgi:O-antigen/teichoic acid export membrane protein
LREDHQGSLLRAATAACRRALQSDFVRKVLETFATRILLIGIGFATSVLVARILGPEGRGLFAVAGAIAAIAIQFGNLGLHSANTYSVARDRSLLPGLLANSLLVSFVLGGLVGIIAWGLSRAWPSIAPVPDTLLLIALASIPPSLAYMLAQNLLLGIQEVRAFNKIELATRVITVGLITLVVVIGFVTPETVLLAGLAAGVINLCWVLWHLRPFIKGPVRPSWSLLKDNIAYGFRVYLNCLFAFLVIKLDLLMVQYMMGAEHAGYYSISVSLADLVYLLPVVIGTILFPKLAALDNIEEKWSLTNKTALVVAAMMIGISTVSIALARPAVHLVFGAEYLPAVPAFLVLAGALVFLGINTIYSNFLASTGLPWFTVGLWGSVTVLNVVLNLVMIPKQGIMGAALASLACYALALVIQYLYARRYKKSAAAN